MSFRLPIFRDDLNFNDRRPDDIFRDLQRSMDADMERLHLGMQPPHPVDWPIVSNEFRSSPRPPPDFFNLHPRATLPRVNTIKREDLGSSRESLDEDVVKAQFVEDSQTKGRKFQVNFDVRAYRPDDISVKVLDSTVTIDARTETLSKDGIKMVKEFSRKVTLPKDVDPNKLTSTLSGDGILTIEAPTPPSYKSIVFTPSPLRNVQQQQRNQQQPTYRSDSPLQYVQSADPVAYQQPQQQQAPSNYSQTQQNQQQQMNNNRSSQQQYQQPVRVHMNTPPPQPLQDQLGVPRFFNTTSGRRFELSTNIDKLYSPGDIAVRVDGSRSLVVEAVHVNVSQGQKQSKSTMSREFDLAEAIDFNTIQAVLGDDGVLKISANVL